MAFVRDLLTQAGERLIAVDGKTSWRSHDGASRALHLVSAFATEARLVLAQTATAEKSNEITAIPALLGLFDLCGATVFVAVATISWASKATRGPYTQMCNCSLHRCRPAEPCTPVKKPARAMAVPKSVVATSHLILRGSSDIAWLQDQHAWPGFQNIARITATRIIGATTTTEVRYDISDDTAGPAHTLANTRSHWAIETTLHWTLDMSFGDDACRIRKDNAPWRLRPSVMSR